MKTNKFKCGMWCILHYIRGRGMWNNRYNVQLVKAFAFPQYVSVVKGFSTSKRQILPSGVSAWLIQSVCD